MPSDNHPEDFDLSNFDPTVHQVGPDGGPVLSERTGKMLRQRGPKAAPGGPASAPRASSKARGTDYRPGLLGIAQLVCAPLMVVAPADAAAVAHHAPNIVEALQSTSEVSPGLAGLLDRILTVGPWALVVSATLPLLVQLAANHKVIPVGMAVSMGAEDPDAILRTLGIDPSANGSRPREAENVGAAG